MNMVKLRQILEMRRTAKAPPLIPPKPRRSGAETEAKRGPKEIVDIHLRLRKLHIPQHSTRPTSPRVSVQGDTTTIACVFSESEDGQQGPWKVSTACEVTVNGWHCDPCIELASVFAVEFQLERCQFIKLDVCDLFESQAVSLGYAIFAVSELVVCENGRICRDVVNDEVGECVAEADISCTLRPKPHSVLLQFATKGLTMKGRTGLMSSAAASTQVFFEIHRDGIESPVNNGQTATNSDAQQVLYRSETVKLSSSRIQWRSFCLQSTEITGRELEVVCLYRDSKTSRATIGHFSTDYNQLKKGVGADTTYYLTHDLHPHQRVHNTPNLIHQPKTYGTFELTKINEIALPSFLEFVSSGCALNLALAIDFSRPANLPVEESSVRRYLDDVEVCIRALGEPLRHFNASSSFPAFGFGAKIPPHYRESQEFCLNLDTDPYCRGLDGVHKAFKSAFANVQPLNMVHLSHVIYYVSKLAQSALNRNNSSTGGGIFASSSNTNQHNTARPSYFVLVVITRGIFDDLKETVQSIIFASRAPISVVFVGIGESTGESNQGACDLGELERLATAGTRLNYHGRKPERDCVQFVSLARCRKEESKLSELKCLLAERALLNIPWQMATWMVKNGFKPHSTIIADPPVAADDEAPQIPLSTMAAWCKSDVNPEYWSQQSVTNSADSPDLNVVDPCFAGTPKVAAHSSSTHSGHPLHQLPPLMGRLSLDSWSGRCKSPVHESPRHPPIIHQNTVNALGGTYENQRCKSPMQEAYYQMSSFASGFGSTTSSLESGQSMDSQTHLANASSGKNMPRFRKIELDSFSISSLPNPRRMPSTNSLIVSDGHNQPTNDLDFTRDSPVISRNGRTPNIGELRSRSIEQASPPILNTPTYASPLPNAQPHNTMYYRPPSANSSPLISHRSFSRQ
ncbi:copine domain-containing protein [Ditylenchus destructor]|nr:copine domain-containing protein [Ditylenchus destructor]